MSRVGRRRSDDGLVIDRSEAQFFAAYEAWEAASEARYAKVLAGASQAALESDLASLQRMHAEWLKLGDGYSRSRTDVAAPPRA